MQEYISALAKDKETEGEPVENIFVLMFL